jgi:hypothetical protein
MTYDDLPLAPTGPTPGKPPSLRTQRPSVLRWVLVIVMAMATGGLLTFWWMSRAQPEPATPVPTAATDVPIGSNRPTAQDLTLPELAQSDAFLRELVAVLSQNPLLARLMATDQVVRSVTLAIVQIGDGKTPATPLAVLRPSARLRVLGASQDSTAGRIDPASYERWNGAVAALTSVDPADAAQLYVNVKPLFDQAYDELGQGADFDQALVAAADMLAATPEPTGDPMLLRRPGYFEHDDALLRSLRPVQKQFLLIGPENRLRVMTWLRQVATHLDLEVR